MIENNPNTKKEAKGILISVVVPVFNMAAYIDSCLQSIINQAYANVQIIVVDGDSTDGTQDNINKYRDHLYSFISETDKGQSHALNKGFKIATGDIYCWLNADEEYLPGALSLIAQEFNRSATVDFVYGNRLDCKKDGSVIRTQRKPKMHPKYYTLYCGGVFPTDASFWRANTHSQTGELDENDFQHLAMDYDWFLRLSFFIKDWVYLDQPLSKFKHHPLRKTALADSKEIERLWSIARENVIKRYGIPKARLIFGWLLHGSRMRLQMRQFKLPRLRTALKFIQYKR